MKIVWILAKNTYHEIIRDRILYGLVMFALLLIGLSLALGQLSFAEQARISIDFGFTSIHLSATVLAIFLGSTLVYKEIEKKTILTLLVRPLTRWQFLLGKAAGLIMVIMTLIFGLAIVLALLSIGMEQYPNEKFFLGLYGVVLESVVLLGVTLFLSSFARPIMVVIFAVAFSLIGHWIDSLAFFAARSQSEVFHNFSQGVIAIFPNLEKFNWRALFIYNESLDFYRVAVTSLYALLWFAILLAAASMIIRRKDFV